ncbi:MAG: hypothetical protein H0T89_35105 [Deltaproteobacteria bacterium]|nr:hypothetical protein [Deltaproteobacteria bacterium]MDQ3300625.1 hypothetical protein [Myxococcota bacterium]
MRQAPIFAFALAVLAGCVIEDASPDGIDESGASGKADGTQLTECETREILALLNEGATAEALQTAGVHTRAARELAAHRDGDDGTFATADDDLFDTIDEVDEVAYVGRTAFGQLAAAVAARCVADPYAEARDVTKARITFPPGTAAPTSYDYPEGNGFNLGGTEFWQKWSGGHNPTYSFSEGTDAGRLCMQAAAYRFEEIMKDPPADLVKLNADTNWGGSFFNWNDDFSNPSSFGNAGGARLWAWRTGLIKWISQTSKDGSCFLPTRDLVERAAKACLDTAVRNGTGEIQGCSAAQ